mgnify:CR=1 FL=1
MRCVRLYIEEHTMTDKTQEVHCKYLGDTEELCWVFQPDKFDQEELTLSLRETIARCLKCPVFDEAIRRSTGRRKSDKLLTLTLHRLLGQLVDYDTELVSITGSLQKKVEELAVLKSVSEALLKTQDLRKVMLITLTGVTSGEAFGFNRGMVFLVNTDTKTIDGQIGLGHLERDEAPMVWSQISSQKLTFDDLIDRILNGPDLPPNRLTTAIEKISIPLRPEYGILPRTIIDKQSYFVESFEGDIIVDRGLRLIMKDTPFAAIPLIYEGSPLGVILVDNSINHKPITAEDIATLETLANQAASKIENAILQNKLEVRFAELQHIHALLMDNQKYLVKSERLADLGRLATTVAHEIKTPLITIGGYADRVLKKAEAGQIDLQSMKTMHDEIMRLERICKEMLDYSQKSQLNLEQNDLNQIISETLHLEAGKLKYQNINFETDFYPEKLQLLSDKDRLKQVLYNLIHNAAEAMANGGKIKIQTGRKGDYVFLRIEDNGCGMESDVMQKLFTPFFTNKRNGTGLGLPVSKKIIDDHGGNIVVESEPNKGTAFTINLPCKNEKLGKEL